MPDVPASTDALADPVAAPTTTEPTVPDSVAPKPEDVAKAVNASQMAARVARGLEVKVDKLTEAFSQLQVPNAPEPGQPKDAPLPAGLEDRMKELELKVQASEAALAKEKLDAAILQEAGKKGVDPHRIDYLTYKLKQEHGSALTFEGVPDAIAPDQRTSISALLDGLLGTSEGAVFKAAPTATTLPTQGTEAAPEKKTIKRADFDAMARDPKQRDAYKATLADMKAGTLQLAD